MSKEKDAQFKQDNADKEQDKDLDNKDNSDDNNSAVANQGKAEKSFSQSEVNKFVGDARIKVRKQYEEQLKDLDELRKYKQETEEKLGRLQELEAKEAQFNMRTEVMEETGLDYEAVCLLGGDTKEELLNNAQKYKAKLGSPVEYLGQNSHHQPKNEKNLEEESKDFLDEVFSGKKKED